jgi:hypothetical protein
VPVLGLVEAGAVRLDGSADRRGARGVQLLGRRPRLTAADAEHAWRAAIDVANKAWDAWWESDATLFPDRALLAAAEAAEARLQAAFEVAHRLRIAA